MHKYVAPTFHVTAFNCPFCNAYASFDWTVTTGNLWDDHGSNRTAIELARCKHCKGDTYWEVTDWNYASESIAGRMVVPSLSVAPLPHEEMPESVAKDFMEARGIVTYSPRGAAALLRLSVQRLCGELGEKGKDINADIASLVQKGLPVPIRNALDVVRVIGNNAVHPGKLSDEDITEIAISLFDLVNAIVEDRIARPKALSALYDRLPEGARRAIEDRDAPETANT